MTASKSLPARPSLESLRKQAKQLAHEVADGNLAALERARAHIPHARVPISHREAQLILAREYGFDGWQSLKHEALKRTGNDLEAAALSAERAIHDNDTVRLQQLLTHYPTLLAWRDGEDGATLLRHATESFGDSGDAFREEHFTRAACAEVLIDAGAVVDSDLWRGIVASRARGMMQLFSRKGLLPRSLLAFVALNALAEVRECFDSHGTLRVLERGVGERATVNEGFMCACRWGHTQIATFLLERCIALDSELGRNVDASPGRPAFIAYLHEHPREFDGRPHRNEPLTPWETFVLHEVMRAVEANALDTFARLLREQSWLLGDDFIGFQIELLQNFSFKNRESFMTQLLALEPAVLRTHPAPASAAIEYALEYGNRHLLPLLTQLWPLPDDLPHAAGIGDFARVQRWFDASGKLALGDLNAHYPINAPRKRSHLHWGAGTVQQVLDVALAWACMNRHLDIAAFLIARGANVDSDWSTHEPASILHECAVHENYEAAQFLIDHGADLTRCDYRWNATPQGWARYAAQSEKMATFLAEAQMKLERKRTRRSSLSPPETD